MPHARNDPGRMVYVAIGSNLGNPGDQVRAAMARLQSLSDAPLRKSSLYKTAPVDCPPGSPEFINAVVGLAPAADETPESLLLKLQRIERDFGRNQGGPRNEARPLDLDIVAFGDETRTSAELTLPHPRATLRGFVLQPLGELAPGLVLPGQTKTVERLLWELAPGELGRKVE